MIWHTVCPVYYSNKLRARCSKYKPECQLFKFTQTGTDALNEYLNSLISDDKSDLLSAHPSLGARSWCLLLASIVLPNLTMKASPECPSLCEQVDLMSSIDYPRNYV